MLNTEAPKPPSILFNQNSRWLTICLVVLFLLAALIRRDEIKAPGHLIEREYNSAIFARAFYLSGNDDVEPWQRDIAFAARDQLPTLEPPLTEYLVSIIYRIVGQEEIWYARYLTSFFWLIGGIFFYKIVRTLMSTDAALFAVAYYLFAPWGIIISRSFQPDSLMMMMFLISLFGIVKYFEETSWRRLLLAGILTGVSLLLRPLVLFVLFGAFLAMSIQKKRRWFQIFDKHLFIFVFSSLIFPLAFYGYGIYFAGFLQGQADLSFRPYLLNSWRFWVGWFDNGVLVVGRPFFIVAIIGFFLIRDKFVRLLVVGMSFGYFVFGLFFTFHIHTHPYYHIQLLPLMGICIAPVFVVIGNILKKSSGMFWWSPILASFLAVMFFSSQDVRSTFYTTTFENPKVANEIGEIIHHNPHSVFVAYHYGLPLEYYGQIAGKPWPVSIDDPFYRRPDARELSVQERLKGLGFEPEYFVVTNFGLFNRKHLDLKAYLDAYCTLQAQTDQYQIYGSCLSLIENEHPITSLAGSGN